MSPQDKTPSMVGPGPTHKVGSEEEMWALIKFRLVAFGDPSRIEIEIDRMVAAWKKDFDPSGEAIEVFRQKLYSLVREGLDEDRVAYFDRRKH